MTATTASAILLGAFIGFAVMDFASFGSEAATYILSVRHDVLGDF